MVANAGRGNGVVSSYCVVEKRDLVTTLLADSVDLCTPYGGSDDI
jgi:hypothetical protein